MMGNRPRTESFTLQSEVFFFKYFFRVLEAGVFSSGSLNCFSNSTRPEYLAPEGPSPASPPGPSFVRGCISSGFCDKERKFEY